MLTDTEQAPQKGNNTLAVPELYKCQLALFSSVPRTVPFTICCVCILETVICCSRSFRNSQILLSTARRVHIRSRRRSENSVLPASAKASLRQNVHLPAPQWGYSQAGCDVGALRLTSRKLRIATFWQRSAIAVGARQSPTTAR